MSGHWVRDGGVGGLQNRGLRTPIPRRPPVEENPTRICELLVGLGDMEILGVDDSPGGPLCCTSGLGRGRPAGAAAGRCGRRAPARWGWWTFRRLGARCAWCGASGGGAVRRQVVWWGHSPGSMSRSRRPGRRSRRARDAGRLWRWAATPARSPMWPHPRSLAHRHRQLAPRTRLQRAHRSRQQSDQASQTRRLRIPSLRALPHPRTPLRRQTQLDPPRLRHSPLKSEAPTIRDLAVALIEGSFDLLDS